MKNKLMRAATILMVLTLMTSCFVGSTFAKYTSMATGSDNARVANWGFETPANLELGDLFKNAYDSTVNAAVDVIAPGTDGSETFQFKYDESAGTAPEVAYTFTVSTDGSSCHSDIQSNPNIQWKLDNGEWGTWTALTTAIENLDGNKDYNPGELPEKFTVGDDTHTVYWQWLFETVEGDPPVVSAAQDKTDTDMGNADTLADTKLVITITATQKN